jgi:ApbE superfamily uncharacterized protein (UPF0280 family)
MKEKFQLKQTVVTIVADNTLHIAAAKNAIRYHRRKLEQFILLNPFFRFALEPFDDYVGSPPHIVRKMIEASNAADVGPMAAVAGVISDLAVEAMVGAGARYAIVDNGGDIALSSDRDITVGIYAGNTYFKNIGLCVEPVEFIGICTSSATVGPSISFGTADAACVVAETACLADAAASALGNASSDVCEGFNAIKDINGVYGALVISGGALATWGKLPKIIRAYYEVECITRP